MALCAGLMPATARADHGPDAADRVAKPVGIRIEGVEALGEHVLVVFNVGCSLDSLSDYAVVPAAPARLERSVGEEGAEGCDRQRLYALPRARFVVAEGKIGALDALAPEQRQALLRPEDVLEAELGIPFYWVNSLNVLSTITAEYRVAISDDHELVVTPLRVEFMYQGGQKIFEAPPAEADSDDAAVLDEDDAVPYAPFHPDFIPGREPRAAPPVAEPAAPALAPAEPAGPTVATAPVPVVAPADPPADPPAATAYNWNELALGGGCLVIAAIGGLALRRKR